jgi:hypothetical protein
MFVIDENSSEVGGSKFINVTPETCVAKNRFLVDIVVDTDAGFMDVFIKDRYEKTAKKRYYIPALGKSYIDTEERLKSETSKLVGILTNLSRTVCGEDYKSKPATTLNEFVSNVVGDIKRTPGWNSKEYYFKVVLDKNNFPTLPGYSPVMKPATLTLDEVKAAGLIVKENDKVVRTATVTPTPTEDKPVDISTDKLPF